MGSILDVIAMIRAIGRAAKLSAVEVAESSASIERSVSRTSGGSSNTGGVSSSSSSGGSGSSGSTMTGGSSVAGALVAEIRRIVR